MPSLALPSAVVATSPSAVIAQSGQSTGSSAADASAIATIGDADGGAVFAALLGQQMATAALPADGALAGLIATADPPETAPADPAGLPADLSALLQALLLPMTAHSESVAEGDPNSAPAETLAAKRAPAAVAAAVPAGGSLQALSAPAIDSPALGQDSFGLADLMLGDAAQPAADAAVAGKPAEYAARELPVLPTQPDSLTAAPMVAHAAPQAGRIEMERLVVSTPVASPTWHEDLGTKVTMLIGKEASSAELVLTPPHLGRVEVQLSVSADQTSATFVAATPAAREALEQSLPKLREFLAAAGINLTQASVGGDAQPGQGNFDGKRGNRPAHGAQAGGAIEIVAAPASMRRIDGMVDTFA